MIRLGFAVRILGRPGLRSHDGRRWQHGPHLSVSLVYLRDIIAYLEQRRIFCYRLAEGLAPYLVQAEQAGFERQIEECAAELAEVGALARAAGLRLTMHLDVALASPDAGHAARAVATIVAQA